MNVENPDEDRLPALTRTSLGLVLRFALIPLTSYVAMGTPDGLVGETVRVVHAVNIVVRDNTFIQTGDVPGLVTEVFFDSDHAGMGSILVRDDLSAGCGSKR